MVEINKIQLYATDEPLFYRCPYCMHIEIEFITNILGNKQSRCKACLAMGPTTKTEQHSKNHLKLVFQCLHEVEMRNWKPEKGGLG